MTKSEMPDFSGLPAHVRDIAFQHWVLAEGARTGQITQHADGSLTARVTVDIVTHSPRRMGVITSTT